MYIMQPPRKNVIMHMYYLYFNKQISMKKNMHQFNTYIKFKCNLHNHTHLMLNTKPFPWPADYIDQDLVIERYRAYRFLQPEI